MAGSALWFGWSAAPVATARVLEIGCASGGHLIPLAAAWPLARFVGIDVSSVQIEAGMARVSRAGLTNIDLSVRSFHTLTAADGAFDYIICHGVLSWIAEPLRERLLGVICERLAPDGVAMASFNVLPGWRPYQIARDSLLLHDRMRRDRGSSASAGRALIETLSTQSNSRHTYGRFWRGELDQALSAGDAYIAHEFYEDANEPLAFLDFCAALDRHGLAYLGECTVAANNLAAVTPAGAATIEALAGDDDRAREQYIDIFSGRSLRRALLVHGAADGARREQRPLDLDRVHFVAPLELKADPTETGGEWRINAGDHGIYFRDEAAVGAVRRLIARLPLSSTLEDLAPRETTEAEPRKRVAAALMQLVASDLCALSTEPIVCALQSTDRPRAWPLAARDATVEATTASLRHRPVTLDPLQRFYLPLLDGTRTRSDLISCALDSFDSGQLQIGGPDGPVTDRSAAATAIEHATDTCLATFARLALLEAV
jgi:SAM-dependent methyltransferase